jgi:hypothetical protein
MESSPSSAKTWTNFKVHFAAAHREFRLTNQTAQQYGFHSVSMVTEHHPYNGTADAIAQLAVATASDRDTAATLTSTNNFATRNVYQTFLAMSTTSQDDG